MIRRAMEYINELRKPELMEVGTEVYSDKELHRVSYNPKAKFIEMTTLTSLVEYLKANIDSMKAKMLVHVVSPTKGACILNLIRTEYVNTW